MLSSALPTRWRVRAGNGPNARYGVACRRMGRKRLVLPKRRDLDPRGRVTKATDRGQAAALVAESAGAGGVSEHPARRSWVRTQNCPAFFAARADPNWSRLAGGGVEIEPCAVVANVGVRGRSQPIPAGGEAALAYVSICA